jgi:hypothetical protein
MIGYIGTSSTITINYNSSQSMTVWDSLHSLLDYECLRFHCDWLRSDLRIDHFFSLRCPLVNTPQLNTELCYYWITTELIKSKSELCYDRRSAGQSVLEQSTHLGLTTRSWLLSDSCGFVDLGRPLWREDGSVVCNCYWPSPAQSFSGPSPVGLVAIFYCLRFETSLFFASYESQGHGGGIRPRLHTGYSLN